MLGEGIETHAGAQTLQGTWGRVNSASSWRGCSLIHLVIQYLLGTRCVPGPTGNPTMDTVQTKSHTGQGSDKKHHAVPSNSNLLCFNVLQALLLCKEGLCIRGSGATQQSITSEESCPTKFSSFQLFPVVTHSTAEQCVQQTALDMEI